MWLVLVSTEPSTTSSDYNGLVKTSLNLVLMSFKSFFFGDVQLVALILSKSPSGAHVVSEYSRTQTLDDETRRKLVNILVSDMTEKYGFVLIRHGSEVFLKRLCLMNPFLFTARLRPDRSKKCTPEESSASSPSSETLSQRTDL